MRVRIEEKVHSWKKVSVQCLLLALPTILCASLIFYSVTRSYILLHNQWIYQSAYFTLGILLSIVFYSWRFRFTSTAILLAAIYYFGYKLLGKISFGETDVFLFSVQYIVFVFIFSIGWLVGLGFSRWRFFTVAWILILLSVEIILISKVDTVTANAIVSSFAPVLLYVFYIIYASELVRNLNEHQTSFSWFLAKRVGGFFILALFALAIVFLLFKNDLYAVENAWGKIQPNYETEKSNSQSMTKTNRDGTLSNTSKMQLTGSLNKTKQLVFVAHLNNIFPDGQTQNPLYFTANYYTKFDSASQSFTTDSLMPFDDLFSPNPSQIPLFFTKMDSNAIKNSLATLNRKTVETEVYKVALSSADFIAPSTAFSVQPIPVPHEYERQYTSAYRAKMWVSDLNSAYFVYNPAGNAMLENFQKARFDILRTDTSFAGINENFLRYYTQMPQSDTYQAIATLAQQITAHATTTIDKIIAIRNYFLSEDEFGQPLFQYTDNPGIPGLPDANKLDYFLFENRKGYCAYFAGATLFMLRALHIPSRIATGFLTIDRSNKNPGWYWFYEDQAHAWVQVFFPKYGWLDFDTTIPDVNTQQAPQPDGTPPLGTQKVYFVGDGIVQKIDTTEKILQLLVNKILYKEQSFTTQNVIAVNTNIAFARVNTDTGVVPISMLKNNMHVSVASYSQSLDSIDFVSTNDTAAYVLNHLKQPISIDEVKIIERNNDAKKEPSDLLKIRAFDWENVLIDGLIILCFAALLIVFSPWLIWQFYRLRARVSSNTHATYRAVLYYLNQMGYSRRNQSPQAFAQNIDKEFDTNFVHFNQIYQKEKYSRTPLSNQEKIWVKEFYPTFMQQVKKRILWQERTKHFFSLSYTLYFFIKRV